MTVVSKSVLQTQILGKPFIDKNDVKQCQPSDALPQRDTRSSVRMGLQTQRTSTLINGRLQTR